MDIFTEVYTKTRSVLQANGLANDWKSIGQSLKLMLEADGPNPAKAQVLNTLKKKLADSAKGKLIKSNAIAEEILTGSNPETGGFQHRSAMLKAMVHFYLVAKKGSQSVWVVDSPRSYGKWTYDQFEGMDRRTLTTQLKQRKEVFGTGNRRMMADALQMARKWSADIELGLTNKDEATLSAVNRWFHTDSSTEDSVNASISTLAEGFKKIHATCNSTRVIFSDRPAKRVSGTYDNTYASVNSGDVMPVIYIYQLFLKTGKRNLFGVIPKMWLCALTVIHELSHKVAGTDDIRYDDEGLKPGPGFTPAQALTNADSWAYFAADRVGALSAGTVQKTLV